MPFFRVFPCAFLMITLVPFHCLADIVETVTGDRLRCKVLSVESDTVEVESPLFGKVAIERKNISLIRFGHHDIKGPKPERVESERVDATPMLAEAISHMPVSVAAKAIKAIYDHGKTDLVINVLRLMEPRMVAKCLADLQDPHMVAEIAQGLSPVTKK